MDDRAAVVREVAPPPGAPVHDEAAAGPLVAWARPAAAFAQWIVDNVQLPPLTEQAYILDVAGGRGALSFLLRQQHGRRCIVIDPAVRTASMRSQQLLRLTKRERRRLKHLGQKPSLELEQRCEWFDSAFVRQHHELLSKADAIVGMHPDQATEAIVDAALLYGLPCAVVPCCVFPHLAPHRRLPGGKAVTATEDFVKYLELKIGAASGVTSLNFTGANTVVFSAAGSEPGRRRQQPDE